MTIKLVTDWVVMFSWMYSSTRAHTGNPHVPKRFFLITLMLCIDNGTPAVPLVASVTWTGL
jgi:hypothetical protein